MLTEVIDGPVNNEAERPDCGRFAVERLIVAPMPQIGRSNRLTIRPDLMFP